MFFVFPPNTKLISLPPIPVLPILARRWLQMSIARTEIAEQIRAIKKEWKEAVSSFDAGAAVSSEPPSDRLCMQRCAHPSRRCLTGFALSRWQAPPGVSHADFKEVLVSIHGAYCCLPRS